MRKLLLMTFLLVASAPNTWSQSDLFRDPAAKKKVKKKVVTQAKAKTVGDLLKGYQDVQKRQSIIPKSEINSSQSKHFQSVAPARSGALYQQEGQDEAQLEAVLDKEIDELYKLTTRYKNSPNRGELWLRLAELYVEKARMYSYRSENAFDKKAGEWESNGHKGPAPKLDLSSSHSYNKKAIQLYEWFLADFPKDPKVDQALFFLGYNYTDLGNVKKGTFYYEDLTRRFPKSPYVSESHFALGEYYFDSREWKKAEKSYRAVIDNRSARLYSFALYKLAWCLYRQGRTEGAIKTMEAVIAHSRREVEISRSQGLKSVNRIRLASEALKDLVPFYSEVRDYHDAKDYFAAQGGEKAVFPLLERLAYVYSDAGKQEAARYIFKQLLTLNPTAPKAYDYQYQIVQNFLSKGSREIFRQELYAWIKDYSSDGDWAKANSGNDQLLKKAAEQRETTLRNYVLLQHQTAQNTHAKNVQKVADEGYRLYLTNFEKSERSTEMHFLHGELLYDMAKYDSAAREYEYVIENGGNKNKYYEQSVLNSVLAYEKNLPNENEIAQKRGKTLDSISFGASEQKFFEAAKRYLNIFPNGEKAPEVKFKMGRIAYAYNHFDEALATFQEIVQRYPKSQQAVYSANLILDIYNLRKDYEGLARAGTALLKSGAVKSADVSSDIRDAVERASFKRAQDFETSGKFVEAAKQYDAFAKKYPSSKFASDSRYNAAVNYERAGQVVPAIIGYRNVVESRDRSTSESVRKKSLRLLARLYEQTGQYEKAAKELEAYAKEFPKDQYTDEAYFNSAVIWDAEQSNARAVTNYEKYFELSRKADRRQALWAIAEIYEKRASFSQAISTYEKYLSTSPADPSKTILANYKVATLNKKLHKVAETKKWFEKTVAVQKRLSGGKGLGASEAAEARYELAQDTLNELISIRIPQNPKRQAEAVKHKLDLVAKINKEMADVIKYDDSNFVVAALATTGKAYEHISRALYEVPLPAGLSAEEKKTYEGEIDKIAAPLKRTAIENYERAVNKSHELQAYNQWTTEAMHALNRYDKKYFSDSGEKPLDAAVTDLGI